MTLKEAQLKAFVNEAAKQALFEHPQVKKAILENRVKQIQEAIDLNEADWMDRARVWLRNKVWGAEDSVKKAARNTLVNPEKIVNDKQQAMGVITKALQTAKKQVGSFKQDALRSSTAISRLQDSVLDAFGKYVHLVDNIPQEQRGLVEREVMQVVSDFYVALVEEKKRIETYLSYLAKEVDSQGYNMERSAGAMAGYKPEKSKASKPQTQSQTTPAKGKLAGARA